MTRKDLRIGIISDSRNQSIAETYLLLLKGSLFASCTCNRIGFDLSHPERTTELLERQHVALAHVGIPGRHDYQKNLHTFLEAFAAAKRKPAVGLVTHDVDHTRYVIDKWLDSPFRSPRTLPDGALSLVDASKPLRKSALEKAVEMLTEGMPALPPAKHHAIPFTHVLVDSMSFVPTAKRN